MTKEFIQTLCTIKAIHIEQLPASLSSVHQVPALMHMHLACKITNS